MKTLELPAEVEQATRFAIPLWKRSLDLAAIIISLPILVPVMLAMAAFIKCVSRGPVLFKQLRIGHNGREFLCYKFRTMHCGANVVQHADYLKSLIREQKPMTKLDILGDRRVIRFGSVLRATGLDELPQLYNVLRGEMSLVGPRPCTPAEYESYLPWHKNRFLSTPGITGLWQVTGKNRTTFDEMIGLDIEYASRRSLWLDLRILFKTFWVVGLQVCEIVVVKIARALSHFKAGFGQAVEERTKERGR